MEEYEFFQTFFKPLKLLIMGLEAFRSRFSY